VPGGLHPGQSGFFQEDRETLWQKYQRLQAPARNTAGD
jgi:hypothetical protein